MPQHLRKRQPPRQFTKKVHKGILVSPPTIPCPLPPKPTNPPSHDFLDQLRHELEHVLSSQGRGRGWREFEVTVAAAAAVALYILAPPPVAAPPPSRAA